ncbi:hypothetical protein BGX29_003348, partial [Mortierella sp. GBA35]
VSMVPSFSSLTISFRPTGGLKSDLGTDFVDSLGGLLGDDDSAHSADPLDTTFIVKKRGVKANADGKAKAIVDIEAKIEAAIDTGIDAITNA